MQDGGRRRRRLALAIVLIGAAGCSEDGIEVPAAGDIAAPAFQPSGRPEDSPMLGLLRPRDTAGLDPTDDGVDPTVFPQALAALAETEDHPTQLSTLDMYDDSVNIAYEDRGINGRTKRGSFRPDDGWYIGEPSYDPTPTFALADIDPAVPAALVATIEARLPNARVSRMSIDNSESSPYGLVWEVDIDDAVGSFGRVYAELDGAIVAVDLS